MKQADAKRKLGDFRVAEVAAQRAERIFREIVVGADDGIRQRQRGGLGAGQPILIAVIDRIDAGFRQPRLTGGVETNVLSETAIGNPGVADPGHLLGGARNESLLPELGIQRVETLGNGGCVSHDTGEVCPLAWLFGWQSRCRRHDQSSRAMTGSAVPSR